MNVTTKKVLSFLLVMAMVLSMAPMVSLSIPEANAATVTAKTQYANEYAANFANGGTGVNVTVEAACPGCGATNVTWVALDEGETMGKYGTSVKASYHFYLPADMTAGYNDGSGYNLLLAEGNNTNYVNVCLHLNGHHMIAHDSIYMTGSASLNIMGDGAITHTASRGTQKAQFINAFVSTLRIYGSTLIATNQAGVPLINANTSGVGVTMELYDANIIGKVLLYRFHRLHLYGNTRIQMLENTDAYGDASERRFVIHSDFCGAIRNVEDGLFGKSVIFSDPFTGSITTAAGVNMVRDSSTGNLVAGATLAAPAQMADPAAYGDRAYCKACDAIVQWIPYENTIGNQIMVNNAAATLNYHVYLTKDHTVSGKFLNTSENVCLHLNGHDVTAGDTALVATQKLNIMNVADASKEAVVTGHQLKGTNAATLHFDQGAVKLYDNVVLTKTASSTASTVKKTNSSTHTDFIMYGGKIYGSVEGSGTQEGGAAINTTASPFTMNGGSVYGGTTDNHGGAIKTVREVVINAGNVYGGTAVFGGAIYIAGGGNSWMKMTGGSVTGGTSTTSTSDQGGGNIYVEDGFTMEGGTVSGGKATVSGGNVLVKEGNFSMSGGTISDGEAISKGHGGNVFAAKGTVSVSGGTISGGKATANSGGNIAGISSVTISGKANIQGGISGGYAGSIRSWGAFSMTGGTINGGNAGTSGGNIYAKTANISGGTISGGVAKEHGGNIFTTAEITVSGGTISGGTTTVGSGGNIFGSTTVGISGSANIQGGSSAGYAGSIRSSDTFTMTGGTINGGNAGTVGGNLYANKAVNISGGTISGGVATQNAGNVYAGGVFTMSAGTITGGNAGEGNPAGNIHMTVNGNTISGGTISDGVVSGSYGGNIRANGSLTVTDATISGGTAAHGGNIYSSAALTLGQGAILDGGTADDGQSVYVSNAGSLTISGNADIDTKIVANKCDVTFSGTPNVAEIRMDETEANIDALEAGASITMNTMHAYEPITIASDNAANVADCFHYTNKQGVEKDVIVSSTNQLVYASIEIVDANGSTWYGTPADALAAYATAENAVLKVVDYYNLNENIDAVYHLTKDTYLDTCGNSLTVDGTGNLYLVDSANDDFETASGDVTVDSEDVVVVHDVVNPVSGYRYIVLDSEDGLTVSAHRLVVDISTVYLRPSKAGLYYASEYKCDDILAGRVNSYGIALSLKDMPGANFATESNNAFTSLTTGFAPDAEDHTFSTNSSSVFGIFKTTRAASVNAGYGKMAIYANAYVNINIDGAGESLVAVGDLANVGKTETSEGFNGTAMSLYSTLKLFDDNWNNEDLVSKHDAINDFYNTWKTVGMNDSYEYENIGK